MTSRPEREADWSPEENHAVELTIVALFQDEAPFLKEWIEFHRMMGVGRFVLIDDRSTDDYESVLRPYVEAGVVEFHVFPCPPELQEGRKWIEFQRSVLQACLDQLRGVSRWLALVDIDEFLVPAAAEDLLTFLRDHEHLGGIYVRWEPFGTSYVDRLSDTDLVTERLTTKWRYIEGYDMLGKSIVKPHRVARVDIHRCELLPGFEYLDSNPAMASAEAPIRLNHYWARDEHFLFTKKLPRTCRVKGWTLDSDGIEYFRNLFNDVEDAGMHRFLPELRRRVFEPRTKLVQSPLSRGPWDDDDVVDT